MYLRINLMPLATLALGALAVAQAPTVEAKDIQPVQVVNTASSPVPVKLQGMSNVSGSVTVGNTEANPVPVSPALPPDAFSIPPTLVYSGETGSNDMAIDPSGTRYAISSFTVSNPTDASPSPSLACVTRGDCRPAAP